MSEPSPTTTRIFRVQRRMGWLIVAVGVFAMAIQVTYLVRPQTDLFLRLVTVALIILAIVLGLLSVIRYRKWCQVAQVAALFANGYYAAWDTSNVTNLQPELMVLFGIFLLVYYKIIRRRVLLWSGLLLALAIGLKFAGLGASGAEFSTAQFVAVEVLVAVTFTAFWLILRDEAMDYLRQGERVSRRLHQVDVFADLGRNAYGVIHDMSRLDYARTAADLAAKSLDDGDQEAARRFLGHVQGLIGEVDDKVSLLKRQVRNRHQQEERLIDLNDILDDVARYHQSRLELEGLSVDRRLCAEGALVRGVPSELAQAFDNLVDNALAALSGVEGPRRLTLETRCEDGRVIARVGDTGGGIRFVTKDGRVDLEEFQVGRSTRADDGSGWGMHLVKTHIEGNGGQLAVYHQRGLGTTVEVVFVRAEARGEPDAQAPATGEEQPLARTDIEEEREE